jgi:hypothetical protein
MHRKNFALTFLPFILLEYEYIIIIIIIIIITFLCISLYSC